MKIAILTAIAATALGSAAFAQDTQLRFGVGVSSMGATLEGAYRFNENLAMRGVIAGGVTASRLGGGTQTVDGVTYTTSGQLGGFALLADYYTGRTGFRVSGGAFISNTKFSGTANASAANPITIGNTTLNNGELATASVEFTRKISPMLTVGWDQNIGKTFTLSGEVGAIATGNLNVNVTAPGVSAADVAREVQNINDELSQFGVYPYVGITATFRF